MSLRKAVVRILEEIKEAEKKIGGGLDADAAMDYRAVIVWVQASLEAVLDASEEEAPKTTVLQDVPNRPDSLCGRTEEAGVRKSILVEDASPTLTLISGGPEDGSAVHTDPRMPSGAKTVLGKSIYVMGKDRILYYSEEETEKFLTPPR